MLIIPAVLLVAVTTTAQPKPTPLPTLAPAMMKMAMPSFSAKDLRIRVKAGQPFQVRMNVTSGTGYSWQPQGPMPPGVVLLGVFQRPSSKTLPGGPGQEVLVFRASDVGMVHLALEYVRPWEHPVKPAKSALFTVTVHK
jgi:predicted secreted protein